MRMVSLCQPMYDYCAYHGALYASVPVLFLIVVYKFFCAKTAVTTVVKGFPLYTYHDYFQLRRNIGNFFAIMVSVFFLNAERDLEAV